MSTTSLWKSALPDAFATRLRSDTAAAPRSCQVAILGGGLAGLACARSLAERGRSVVVLETGELLGASAEASLGAIWPAVRAWRQPAQWHALAMMSRDLWSRMAVRPPFECGWRVNGTLELFDSPQPLVVDHIPDMQNVGYSVAAADVEQVSVLEPALVGAAGGLHYPSEAVLNPLLAAASLARDARDKGARLYAGVALTGLQRDSAGLSLQTTAGAIQAQALVVTQPHPALNLPIPVRTLHMLCAASGDLEARVRASLLAEFPLVPLRGGGWLSGAEVTDSTEATAARLLSHLQKHVPQSESAVWKFVWDRQFETLAERAVVIGPCPGRENIWLALPSAHYETLLAPGLARVLSEWLLDGQPTLDLAPFLPHP